VRCSLADREMVQAVLTDDSVWPFITEDNTPDEARDSIAELYLGNQQVHVVNPAPGVVFLLLPFNATTGIVHTAIIESARGRGAIDSTKMAIEWAFKNTAYRKIITVVPAFNRRALLFALKAGMKKEGCITRSFSKYGQLHDQFILGLSREE